MIQRPDQNQGTAPNGPQGIRQSGTTILLALCLVIVLAFTLMSLTYSHQVLERAVQKNQAASVEVSQIQRQEVEVEKRAKLETMTKRLLTQAKTEGLLYKNWNERRINIQSTSMPRERINELMTEISNNPNQIFGAEQFDISVKEVNYGLFDPPSAADDGIAVSLKGVALFRSTRGQQ